MVLSQGTGERAEGGPVQQCCEGLAGCIHKVPRHGPAQAQGCRLFAVGFQGHVHCLHPAACSLRAADQLYVLVKA